MSKICHSTQSSFFWKRREGVPRWITSSRLFGRMCRSWISPWPSGRRGGGSTTADQQQQMPPSLPVAREDSLPGKLPAKIDGSIIHEIKKWFKPIGTTNNPKVFPQVCRWLLATLKAFQVNAFYARNVTMASLGEACQIMVSLLNLWES